MKKKIYILLTALCFPAFTAIAQNNNSEEEIAVHFNDKTWYDKGFDFYIEGGIFFGNKFNANYYNGSNLNENNLYYLFENEYWRREIGEQISEHYPYISNIESVLPELDPNSDTYDWNSHYKASTLIALGIRYKIRNGWAISLSYAFSRLKVNTHCLLHTPADFGNMRKRPEMAILGKEDRSMIDLSVSYLFSQAHPVVKPFLEVGLQFNYAKVKSLDAMLLNQDGDPVGSEYTLLDYYHGQGYYPGAMSYDDVIFGGAGFGISGATGLKIVVNKNISLDPTFYGTFSKTGIYERMNSPLPEYHSKNKFVFNYGVMLRIIMNDFFVSKNH